MADTTSAKMVTIYVLCDSREPDSIRRVRYVGRTIKDLERRLRGHIYQAQHGDRTWRSWSVYAEGGDVLIEAVACVPVMWVDAAEIDLIAKYRAQGCRLTNLTDGGGGLLNAVPETRERIGAAKRGNKFWVGKHHTPEARAKIAAAHRGKPSHPNTRAVTARPEVRAKIAATLTGRKLSAEELATLRAARKAWQSSEAHEAWLAKVRAAVNTPEHRARLRAQARRPEALARISALGKASRGKKMSEAVRAACAERSRGRTHTEATKAKMSAWQRGGSSHRAKLTWEQVAAIRERYAAGGISQCQLARDYGVQPRTINLIVHNKTWVAA